MTRFGSTSADPLSEPDAAAEPGSQPWWQPAVIYQIYPRSFQDANGDGVGDLEGVRRRLDHLVDLGVDAVWLSPIYKSPMADFGYDVADYTDVDPLFGDLETFDRLLAEAHARGLRVLLDWVPNHTSDQHPWFLESRSSRTSSKRDWYWWRDTPNNWTAAFSDAPTWTYDEHTGQYYLHTFLPQQPDLNWTNPEVVGAMHNVLRFWLDRGVDGFRADVVHLIGKDPALPDDPPERVGTSGVGWREHSSTHVLLRGIRSVIDSYDDRVLLGEVNLHGSARLATYHGQDDELHLVFDFGLIEAPWDAAFWERHIDGVTSVYAATRSWPTWVLANHDQRRLVTQLGSRNRARAAAVLQLSLRGTAVLYAGQELGLEDAEVPADRVVDPGGRDGCRAPMPWEPGPAHGWPTADPWLPWPPDADDLSVAAQRQAPGSTLSLYRDLIAHRAASPALRRGAQTTLRTPDGIVAVLRSAEEQRRVVLVNMSDSPVDVDLEAAGAPGSWRVVLDSAHGAVDEPWTGAVPADRAVLLAD